MNKFGALFSNVDVRDYKAVCSTPKKSLPKEFELPIIRVKNQSSINSCVAHTLSSIVEYFNYIQHNKKTEMSTGYIYGNRNTSSHKGEGMVIRDALAALKAYGDVEKTEFPDNIEVPIAITKFNKKANELFDKGYPNRISSYYRLKTETDIKNALLNKYPVVMAMKWYGDIRVVNGILTTKYKNYRGGHCMLIYGWNEKGWKVLNSWGTGWGNKGTVIIPYNIKIRETWAVVDSIKEGVTIKKPFSSDAGKMVGKVLNTLGNLNGKIKK